MGPAGRLFGRKSYVEQDLCPAVPILFLFFMWRHLRSTCISFSWLRWTTWICWIQVVHLLFRSIGNQLWQIANQTENWLAHIAYQFPDRYWLTQLFQTAVNWRYFGLSINSCVQLYTTVKQLFIYVYSCQLMSQKDCSINSCNFFAGRAESYCLLCNDCQNKSLFIIRSPGRRSRSHCKI